jgi:hypothetical protein
VRESSRCRQNDLEPILPFLDRFLFSRLLILQFNFFLVFLRLSFYVFQTKFEASRQKYINQSGAQSDGGGVGGKGAFQLLVRFDFIGFGATLTSSSLEERH